MSTPYLGQIQPFPFNFAPKGWALCNGQIMSIQQNAALFSLLGTTYGGNGTSTFALPNLQGQCAISMGNGYTIGQTAGEGSHTLSANEIPQHTHTPLASATTGNASSPINSYPAAATSNPYFSTSPTSAVSSQTSIYGQSLPHENQQPYLVLNFCIALTGIFPSRN